MKLTQQGLELIKEFEGFRARAYRDAGGVLTIGYGHTSMAGPPSVTNQMELTQQEAEALLQADLERFESELRPLLRRAVSDAQFSALMSFAYNVGIGNVAGSGVLAAVNRGDFEAVPRRLSLWVNAAGRPLPGLIRRRAAEAALFSGGPSIVVRPEPPRAKPVTSSRTLLATLIASLAAMAGTASGPFAWLMTGILLAALGVIAYERLKKLKQECI